MVLISSNKYSNQQSLIYLLGLRSELTEKATKQMRLEFQRITDEACMVIFLLSQAFATSRSCQQQVFYHSVFHTLAGNSKNFYLQYRVYSVFAVLGILL